MNPEIFALAVTAAVFAGGAVGLILQRSLHEKYTSGGPRDMIGAVVGLLTLLSALVLGLLIWTAYGTYSGQKAAVQTPPTEPFPQLAGGGGMDLSSPYSGLFRASSEPIEQVLDYMNKKS